VPALIRFLPACDIAVLTWTNPAAPVRSSGSAPAIPARIIPAAESADSPPVGRP
jgi:hypothetical protein